MSHTNTCPSLIAPETTTTESDYTPAVQKHYHTVEELIHVLFDDTGSTAKIVYGEMKYGDVSRYRLWLGHD